MKKKLTLLLAVLMLVLAGCGSKVNDHVVDYKLDIPDGFVETEMEELEAIWVRSSDNSNINLNVVAKTSTTNAGFKAVTADILRETVVSTLKDAYNVEPTVTDRYFTKNDVSGLTAYQYSYDVEIGGQSMTQIIVCINADKTYTFTYTTNDAATVKAFDESAKNIQLVIE